MCHTKKSVLVESLFLLLATQSRPRSCGHVSMEIRIYLFGEQLTSRRKQEPQYEVSRILTILTTVRCRYNKIYSLHNWLPWYSFCIKTVRLKKSAAPIKRNAINAIEYKLNSKPALRWRHTGCDSVSNHQPHHCLLNRLFRRRSKKTSKLRVTGLCVGNSPGTGEFPAQMASNAANVSIWWRHHGSWWHIYLFTNVYNPTTCAFMGNFQTQ